jgi:hypothetical protein
LFGEILSERNVRNRIRTCHGYIKPENGANRLPAPPA